MGNALAKVVFEDGSTLYTIGDSTTIVLERLYRDPDQARAAYYDGDEDEVTDGELLACHPEPVECWTQYGSGKWTYMLTQNAEADRNLMVLTLPPHYPEPVDRFGFGEMING